MNKVRDFIKTVASVFAFTFVTFAGLSLVLAQDERSLQEISKPVLDAIMSGDYALAAALGLVLVVALIRRYGGSRWPWLASATVAPILVMVGSFGASLGNTFAAGGELSGGVLLAALQVALFASGGYALLKPLIAKLRDIAPDWMLPFFALVDWVFAAKARAKAKATEAGKLAVEKNPGKGADIDFKDFP